MIRLRLEQSACPASLEIESRDPARPGAFVVRHAQGVSAYLNRCPHTGAPLNWQPDQFLDPKRQHILCSLHGALFRLDDGYCVAGPCQGDALSTLPVKIATDHILVDYDP